jgi:hypothetical protein
VVKNTAVKITCRLPAADDRAVVGATMNLTSAQSEYLVTLPPGEAAVHTDGMDFPVLARMPDGTTREASSIANTADPGPVIGLRSPSCGPDCRAGACTLAQIRAAQRAILDDPRITTWAELAVLAHLTGWTMPSPGTELGNDLSAVPARVRDCAFSHAVDQAVAARASAFCSRVSPGILAAHVATAMSRLADTGQWLCGNDEPQFLAPPYRWTIVRDELEQASRDGLTGRHPASDQWERQYSQPIPGATSADQYQAVDRWYQRDQHNRGTLTVIAWGTRTPAALERAAGTTRTSDDWPSQLDAMLEPFGSPLWPANYLRRRTPAGTAGPSP